MSSSHSLLLTVSGKDRPGITASLMNALCSFDVNILDVEQVVIHGRLILGVHICSQSPLHEVHAAVSGELNPLDMVVDIQEVADKTIKSYPATHDLVMLGHKISSQALSAVSNVLSGLDANIVSIRGVADYPVTGLELQISAPSANYTHGTIKKAVAPICEDFGVDIAIERAGLIRRAKRLVVFDVDSTLVQGEVIEMLAARAGKEAEVREVTEAAMRGELDFEQSLHARVATLAGLDASVVDEVAADLELTSGARTTIRTLKRLGFACGVVSGGFIQVIDSLAEELNLDFARANTLEIVDGKLTGKVTGKVVDRQAKADYLREFAAELDIPVEQTVAVGDGANDIDMLTAAGLGIAFCAKPALREVADAALSQPFLDAVLFFMGITRAEIEHADDFTEDRIPVS